jgi:hypothetical protein
MADSLTKLAQVGAHLFYRWQGWWGTAPAFRRHAADPAAEPLEPRLAALSPAHDAAKAGQDPALLAGLADSDEGVSADTRLSATGAVAMLDGAPPTAMAPGRAALLARHDATTGAATPTDTATIRLTFDPALFPGRYAIQALEACGHRPTCLVLGWRGNTGSGSLDTLAFAYRRDRTNGGEGAWWDCTLTPRTDKAQCLPRRDSAQALWPSGARQAPTGVSRILEHAGVAVGPGSSPGRRKKCWRSRYYREPRRDREFRFRAESNGQMSGTRHNRPIGFARAGHRAHPAGTLPSTP